MSSGVTHTQVFPNRLSAKATQFFWLALFPILIALFHVANLERQGPSQAQLLSLEAHEALGNCDPSSELDHPTLLGARKTFGSQGFTNDPGTLTLRFPSPTSQVPTLGNATGFCNLNRSSMVRDTFGSAYMAPFSNFPSPPSRHQNSPSHPHPTPARFVRRTEEAPTPKGSS